MAKTGTGNGQPSLLKTIKYFIRRPFADKVRLETEEQVAQYGFTRKSHVIRVVKVLVFLGMLSVLIWLLVEWLQLEKVPWSNAFSAILSLGLAIIAYRQWLAARYEISLDKYYDRLENANKRLEALSGVKKEDLYAFVELDKLEYAFVKYQLGYLSPDLALRAVNNFKGLCEDRPGFQRLALEWVNTAAYLEKTRKVVERICRQCTPKDNIGEEDGARGREQRLVATPGGQLTGTEGNLMAEKQKRFTGKVCLVTGGGSGIGRATCIQLATEGGKVVVVDSNEKDGKETVQIINSAGGQSVYIRGDVSVSADVQAAVRATLDKWGKIDILVNNAAVITFQQVVDLTEEEWERVMNVNLRAVFLFCKYSIPYMEGGAIINVSSVHAHKTQSGMAPYAASKAGMEAFTRALSREYPPSRLRVNCVAPGGVDTPMFWNNPAIRDRDPEDVDYSSPGQLAAVICYLASGEAGCINGATIIADKGLLSTL